MAESNQIALFETENNWPFALHIEELQDCLEFLQSPKDKVKVLNVFGGSGSGKSFFSRELLLLLSSEPNNLSCIYLDTPSDELEASKFFEKIESKLDYINSNTRDYPHSISSKIRKRWKLNKALSKNSKNSYIYRVARDLTNQIPIIGPFIKALLPSAFPQSSKKSNNGINFLLKCSHSERIVIAIDNIQFLPELTIKSIEAELEKAGKMFHLILIERTTSTECINWKPSIPNSIDKNVDFGKATLIEIRKLVSSVSPKNMNIEVLAESIFRRSEGNLKSAWFQLKFILQRREKQFLETEGEAYETIIKSLHPIDQAVLRLVVFLLGGFSIFQVIEIFEASDLQLGGDAITGSITDLVALGLLVINSEYRDRVKIEHEIVARTVSELTPEEEKIEFREQLVTAISSILKNGTKYNNDEILYDRLFGITHEYDVRSNPLIQSHIVRFINQQHNDERHSYLANLFRDSVCWDVLDILPSSSINTLLNAVQKCSLFSFGLVATEKLKNIQSHEGLAKVFEAKYLVQLFQYTEALKVLSETPESSETNLIHFNIYLNLSQDSKARKMASKVYSNISKSISEFEFTILRNSGHLYKPEKARKIVNASIIGFKKLGSIFGYATALNNLGIIDLYCGDIKNAKRNFLQAKEKLSKIDSPEIYQTYVNISAVYMYRKDVLKAKKYLRMARDFAPRSLSMDSVMIDYNECVIDLISKKLSLAQATIKFNELAESSRKTLDLRFIELISWFSESLSSVYHDKSKSPPQNEEVKIILESINAGLEILLPINIQGVKLKIPFILSPTWRY